jgi:hypothetical protein
MIERSMVSNDVLKVVINRCSLSISVLRVDRHDALVLLLMEEEAVGFMLDLSLSCRGSKEPELNPWALPLASGTV